MNEPSGTVHEAYAFVCLRCGHRWEQTYEIRHGVDLGGRPSITYFADGRRVPSPLGRLTCQSCEAQVVHITRVEHSR